MGPWRPPRDNHSASAFHSPGDRNSKIGGRCRERIIGLLPKLTHLSGGLAWNSRSWSPSLLSLARVEDEVGLLRWAG